MESIPQAIPFYRNAKSQFISGYASSSVLENSFLRSEGDNSYQVQWDHKTYHMQGKDILFETSLAEQAVILKSTSLRKEAKSVSLTLLNLKAETKLNILSVQSPWVLAQVPETDLQGWVLLSEIRSETFHQGKMISLIDTFLKSEPKENSKLLTTIPKFKEITPKEMQGEWVKVYYQGLVGYVPLQNFALRADFCNWAYDKNKKSWIAIKYRQGANLITTENEKTPLSHFIGFYAQPRLGISIASADKLPPLRSHLFISKTNQASWKVSLLKGHGEVWWQPKESRDIEPLRNNNSTITTDELFQRKIFSYAFNEKTTLKGIVSSSGIFITKDGLLWSQISEFKSQNHPVSISEHGILYVGPYKSLDQGNSFQNYIRWEKVTGLLQNKFKRTPPTLKIEEVQSTQKQNVEILVNTGVQKIRFSGNPQHNNWNVIGVIKQ